MRITQFNGAKDHSGQYGGSKIVSVNDETGKKVTGFVPLADYNEADWQVGKSHDLPLENKGKYGWQFKWKKKSYQAITPEPHDDRVLKGVIEIYKLLKAIDAKLSPPKEFNKADPTPAVESWDAFEPPADDSTPF